MIDYLRLTKDYFETITPEVLKTTKELISGKNKCRNEICYKCILSSNLSKTKASLCIILSHEYFKDRARNKDNYDSWTEFKGGVMKKILDNLGYADTVKLDLTEY